MQYMEVSNKSVQEVVDCLKEVASKYKGAIFNMEKLVNEK